MTAKELAIQNQKACIENIEDEVATVKAAIAHGYPITGESYVDAVLELHGSDIDPDWEHYFAEIFEPL